MPPRLEMRHLAMLITVADAPSMAQAAAVLGLTQSALTHRLREGVPPPGEAADEAAAAELAPGLEPAVDPEELAPGREAPFAIEEAAEDDAPAPEEGAGDGLDPPLFVGDPGAEEAPPPGEL